MVGSAGSEDRVLWLARRLAPPLRAGAEKRPFKNGSFCQFGYLVSGGSRLSIELQGRFCKVCREKLP